jgi:CRISPR system Cascade subunit CasB
MLTDGFRALWLRLESNITDGTNANTIECWATIASALAYVKKNGKDGLAAVAGRRSGGEQSIISEFRFSQLQSSTTPDYFLRRLRRIIQQIEGDVSVTQLAVDIQQWFAEYNNIKPRNADKRLGVQWAMAYYRSAGAA